MAKNKNPLFSELSRKKVISHDALSAKNDISPIEASLEQKKIDLEESFNNVAISTKYLEIAKIAPDAKISDAKISDAKISDAKISDAKISDAKISDAKISDAKISDAKISDAKISDVKISDVKISDAKVSDAKVSDAKVSDIKIGHEKTNLTERIFLCNSLSRGEQNFIYKFELYCRRNNADKVFIPKKLSKEIFDMDERNVIKNLGNLNKKGFLDFELNDKRKYWSINEENL